jgi:class 3 adenylate cyclase
LAAEAYARHDWQDAFALLQQADADGELDAEGLRLLGKTAEWMSDREACLSALERSYAAFQRAGDGESAAGVALMLVHTHRNLFGDSAGASGWLNRAAHLLSDLPECRQHGWLAARQADPCFRRGDIAAAKPLCERAIDVGTRYGDTDLVAMTLAWEGKWLAVLGQHEDGWALIDEACAAAMGGELGPFATGIVYCNSISAYRDLGEFGRASDWTDAAARWCARQAITGFPGICRVHGAEMLRLRGSWRDAEQEALRAHGELATEPIWGSEALYEIGEVRLRTGDLAGAQAAFRDAHELGRDPQPGASLLLMKQGDVHGALRSIEHVDAQRVDMPPIERARIRAARVEIALVARRADIADADVAGLEELVKTYDTVAMRTLHLTALGSWQEACGDPAGLASLREALRGWQQLEAPYETALLRRTLAEAYRRRGDLAGASRELQAALSSFERLGATLDAQEVRELSRANSTVSPAPAACTFMFTDMVSSTMLVEAIGDEAWTELVGWHDRSLRSCFARFGGEELDHAGDGFFVSFTDARGAVDCAICIQKTLRDHRRDHGFAPRLRIGIHGAKARRVADAYRGKGVHEAARIAALASADEIVASAPSVPSGIRTSNSRDVVLKGISTPVEIVTVDWQ